MILPDKVPRSKTARFRLSTFEPLQRESAKDRPVVAGAAVVSLDHLHESLFTHQGPFASSLHRWLIKVRSDHKVQKNIYSHETRTGDIYLQRVTKVHLKMARQHGRDQWSRLICRFFTSWMGQEKCGPLLLLGPVSLQQPLPAESRPPAGGAEPNSLHNLVFTCICCSQTTRSSWVT